MNIIIRDEKINHQTFPQLISLSQKSRDQKQTAHEYHTSSEPWANFKQQMRRADSSLYNCKRTSSNQSNNGAGKKTTTAAWNIPSYTYGVKQIQNADRSFFLVWPVPALTCLTGLWCRAGRKHYIHNCVRPRRITSPPEDARACGFSENVRV